MNEIHVDLPRRLIHSKTPDIKIRTSDYLTSDLLGEHLVHFSIRWAMLIMAHPEKMKNVSRALRLQFMLSMNTDHLSFISYLYFTPIEKYQIWI